MEAKLLRVKTSDIMTAIGYVISILLLLYPKFSEFINNLNDYVRYFVVIVLIVVPALPTILKRVIPFLKMQKRYAMLFNTLYEERTKLSQILLTSKSKSDEKLGPDEIRQLIKVFNDSVFLMSVPNYSSKNFQSVKIRIPLYSDVDIRSEISYLLSLPLLQRLNYIKQLSFAYLKYPGAVHTRLEHALGTLYLMQKVCESKRKELKLSDKDILFAEIVALLHDVGHSSWGHGLEPLCSLLPRAREDKRYDKIRLFSFLEDDNNPLSIALDMLPNVDRKKILEFFRNPEKLKGKFLFFYDLIDSDADLDRLDYINRDAHHTQGPVGTIDYNTLLDAIQVHKVTLKGGKTGFKLAFDPKAAQIIQTFLDNRESMYVNVYEDDVKTAAEEMLCHAVYAFYDSYSLEDEDLEEILRLNDMSLISLIMLAGHDYEKNLIDDLLHKKAYLVIKRFKVVESPKKGTFEEKVYNLARHLKVSGFQEKVRIEKRFCENFLKVKLKYPIIFIRPPEFLPKKKSIKEIEIENARKPRVIVNGKLLLLEEYLGTKLPENPELTYLRIYASPKILLEKGENVVSEKIEEFIEKEAWKS